MLLLCELVGPLHGMGLCVFCSKGKVAERFRGDSQVRRSPQAVLTPEIEPGHWRIELLHPQDLAGVPIHCDHQAVSTGCKVGHLCIKHTTHSHTLPV